MEKRGMESNRGTEGKSARHKPRRSRGIGKGGARQEGWSGVQAVAPGEGGPRPGRPCRRAWPAPPAPPRPKVSATRSRLPTSRNKHLVAAIDCVLPVDLAEPFVVGIGRLDLSRAEAAAAGELVRRLHTIR